MNLLLDLAFKDPDAYVTIVLVVVGSIVLHELGHALVASWEGDPTPKIRGHLTWNPVVHMGWFSLVLVAVMGLGWGATPVNRSMFRHRRWGDVLVSAAGPAVNLFLACVAGFVLMVAARAGGGVEGHVFSVWGTVLQFNVLLFLLNMIPVPPLDGFSVLDGTFDLGGLGSFLRGAGMFPLLIAILVVNSRPFDVVSGAVTRAILVAARIVVGA